MEIERRKVKKSIDVYKVLGREFKTLQEAESWHNHMKNEMKKCFFKVKYDANEDGSFKNTAVISVDFSFNNKMAVYVYMKSISCQPIKFENGFAQKNFEVIKMGRPESIEEYEEIVENWDVVHMDSNVCLGLAKRGNI